MTDPERRAKRLHKRLRKFYDKGESVQTLIIDCLTDLKHLGRLHAGETSTDAINRVAEDHFRIECQDEQAQCEEDADEATPDIWLEGEAKEDIGVLVCGCALHRDYRDSGDPAMVFCPKHRQMIQDKE